MRGMTLPGEIRGTSQPRSDVALPGRPSKQAASGNHGFAGTYTSPKCIRALFSVKVPGKGAKADAGRFCSLRTITQSPAAILRKPQPGLVKRLVAHWYLYEKAQKSLKSPGL